MADTASQNCDSPSPIGWIGSQLSSIIYSILLVLNTPHLEIIYYTYSSTNHDQFAHQI